jgi:hypothetical protein
MYLQNLVPDAYCGRKTIFNFRSTMYTIKLLLNTVDTKLLEEYLLLGYDAV